MFSARHRNSWYARSLPAAEGGAGLDNNGFLQIYHPRNQRIPGGMCIGKYGFCSNYHPHDQRIPGGTGIEKCGFYNNYHPYIQHYEDGIFKKGFII